MRGDIVARRATTVANIFLESPSRYQQTRCFLITYSRLYVDNSVRWILCEKFASFSKRRSCEIRLTQSVLAYITILTARSVFIKSLLEKVNYVACRAIGLLLSAREFRWVESLRINNSRITLVANNNLLVGKAAFYSPVDGNSRTLVSLTCIWILYRLTP